MAAIRKVWVVEEVSTPGEQQIAQRQTPANYRLNDDDSWHWIIPEDLTEEQGREWNRIMVLLKNVQGEDLRHIICGAGLKDHCVDQSKIDCYR